MDRPLPAPAPRPRSLAAGGLATFVAALVLVSPAPGISAAGPQPRLDAAGSDLLPAAAQSRLEAVRETAASLRRSIEEGGFEARAASVLRAGGLPVPSVPALPAPAARD